MQHTGTRLDGMTKTTVSSSRTNCLPALNSKSVPPGNNSTCLPKQNAGGGCLSTHFNNDGREKFS